MDINTLVLVRKVNMEDRDTQRAVRRFPYSDGLQSQSSSTFWDLLFYLEFYYEPSPVWETIQKSYLHFTPHMRLCSPG